MLLCRAMKVIGVVGGIGSGKDELLKYLRKTFGKDFTLVRVDIQDPLVRYDRLRKRNEERDPLTYEAFQTQDRQEEAAFNISRAVAMADCAVDNSGPLVSLHAEIAAMVASGCLPVI